MKNPSSTNSAMRKVLMQFCPQRVIGDVGIPGDSAGVSQRDFFPLGELVRVGEVEQLVILLFGEALPSSLDGALHASIFALDRFRNVDPAELFQTRDRGRRSER